MPNLHELIEKAHIALNDCESIADGGSHKTYREMCRGVAKAVEDVMLSIRGDVKVQGAYAIVQNNDPKISECEVVKKLKYVSVVNRGEQLAFDFPELNAPTKEKVAAHS